MDDGDPHVGVRLEAEGQDGDADEEHGDDPDTLTQIFRYSVTIIYLPCSLSRYSGGGDRVMFS